MLTSLLSTCLGRGLGNLADSRRYLIFLVTFNPNDMTD